MQIKIEIDVKPEELRRFLGLPDVAGLQEDLMAFVREKLGAASETLDPTSFVRENLHALRESSAWRKLVSAAKATTSVNIVAPPIKKAAARKRSASAADKPKRTAPRKSKAAVSAAPTKKPDAS
jgi:hypothetical protein